jgi:hypothetical protein
MSLFFHGTTSAFRAIRFSAGTFQKGHFSAQKREISIASRTFRRYIASARPTGQIAEKEKHPQWQQAQ